MGEQTGIILLYNEKGSPNGGIEYEKSQTAYPILQMQYSLKFVCDFDGVGFSLKFHCVILSKSESSDCKNMHASRFFALLRMTEKTLTLPCHSEEHSDEESVYNSINWNLANC